VHLSRDFPTFPGHKPAVEWPRPALAQTVLAWELLNQFQEMSMEMTPEGAPSTKRTKSVPAANTATAAKKPRAPRKTLTTKAAAAEPSSEEVGGMIATAAYYLAAARNFTPGHELDDWLEAERAVRASLNG
jgi:hypothetical protein